MIPDPFNEHAPLQPGMRVSKALTAARLNSVASTAAAGATGSSLRTGPGLRVRYGAQGPTISLTRRPMARAGAMLPLDVLPSGIVVPGTILYEMPKIGTTRIDATTPPKLTIPSSGAQYVIVTMTGSLNVVGGIFVRNTFSSIASVVISVATSPPSYGSMISSTGVFVFQLAEFLNGVKINQNGHGPITGELCDDGSKEARAILNLTYADA